MDYPNLTLKNRIWILSVILKLAYDALNAVVICLALLTRLMKLPLLLFK
jgi:hypothetical protein